MCIYTYRCGLITIGVFYSISQRFEVKRLLAHAWYPCAMARWWCTACRIRKLSSDLSAWAAFSWTCGCRKWRSGRRRAKRLAWSTCV